MTTTVHRMDDRVAIYAGDCRDALALLPDACVDAVVTDPPYELGFMGKGWDGTGVAYDVNLWRECYRVLKPGGHLLSFGGTRTWHRLAVAIEDAGSEVRDSIAWLYGSGFPKSLDVSKAIDKAAGAEREVVGFDASRARPNRVGKVLGDVEYDRSDNGATITAPATDAARQWQGWGTALKPAFEPVVVARKPLIGTVAANVLAHGTGALNVDGCRIEGTKPDTTRGASVRGSSMEGGALGAQGRIVDDGRGRWPANVTLDEHAAAELDEQSGTLTSGANPTRRGADKNREVLGEFAGQDDANPQRGKDTGGASRFFYVAKAPTKERPKVDGVAHPTVKPLALMRWLVRLVTPPGGIVLDPFAGSGTTVEAALGEGFRVIACEMTPEYLPLIDARIARVGIVDEGVA